MPARPQLSGAWRTNERPPAVAAAVPTAGLGGPPTGDDSNSGACLAQALNNGLAKRVRQLERDNARLKKRQRKHREAMRELRALVAQHQHTAAAAAAEERPHSTDRAGLECKADRCRPAATIPHQPHQAHCPAMVVSDRVVLQQFPFLGDYDMRGRPFVGADTEKPTLVSNFSRPLRARHVFVNPQLCRLVGHSQEDLLFSKPTTFMILVPDKTWLLHQLLFGTGEPMAVSNIVSLRAEMMQRTGHMVDVHIRAQFFYGPTGQLRCAVVCVEDVLGVRCPPWAQEGSASDEDQQHREQLALYCAELKKRAKLEWRQFRDHATHITPATPPLLQSPVDRDSIFASGSLRL